MSTDVYKNYTSTSVLTGVDVEKFTEWSHQYFKTYILNHIPSNKDCKILEIGCGYGRYTTLLTNILKYDQTIGIDISQEQIEFAQKNYNLNNVFKEDAVKYLKTSSLKYDIVILMDVLEHLELGYAIEMLEKINNALSKGGKLIIQVPNGLSPMKPIFYGDVTHVRAFSVNSMSQILRMAGFGRFQHFALPPMIHGIKSLLHRIIWSTFINPLVYLFVMLSHGSAVGGIYSSNLLTVATKE
jgi:2-polyprenyl-3-methyl-5-hydroxy-6-metoxy-1,4-benzoquinol methylase